MSEKYKNVPKHPGIRKSQATGRYQALKKIKGAQFSETFDSLRDAVHWKNTFNGVREEVKKVEYQTSTLEEVWLKMQELHFPSLEYSTRDIWLRRFNHVSSLKDMHMEEITPTVINNWIESKKKEFAEDDYTVRPGGSRLRCNLLNEVRLITAIFNWYREEPVFDGESRNIYTPIRARHRTMAIIRDTPKKPDDKKIPVQEVFKFFSGFNNELYRDLAMVQFYAAGRIGEIAGIQISNIYFDRDFLLIKESIVWHMENKTFNYLKAFPKNGEARKVFLHPELKAIIERRLKLKHPGSDFLFHVEGRPLNYASIQVYYRTAQQRSGVRYTGTHCLRHGMATLARQVGGNLDATMAMTGHKDMKMADHYSKVDADLQKTTSLQVMDHIRQLGISDDVLPRKVPTAKMPDTAGLMDSEMQQKILMYAEGLIKAKQETQVGQQEVRQENVVFMFKKSNT